MNSSPLTVPGYPGMPLAMTYNLFLGFSSVTATSRLPHEVSNLNMSKASLSNATNPSASLTHSKFFDSISLSERSIRKEYNLPLTFEEAKAVNNPSPRSIAREHRP